MWEGYSNHIIWVSLLESVFQRLLHFKSQKRHELKEDDGHIFNFKSSSLEKVKKLFCANASSGHTHLAFIKW